MGDALPLDRFGSYKVEAKLGEGGMGIVYRAVDLRLGRTVALKVMPSDFAADPDRRGRFEREARAAAAVTHPNIATVYEVGESDGRAFIAMELVEGESLRQRIERGPLPLAEALSVARGIARGLARAHDKGVVHRDLKPDNVMITDEGEAKILDFGLARQVGLPSPTADTVAAPMTQVGQIMGSPGYMSPEQAAGQPVDARTDVFSLGVVLYQLVCGRRPFQGSSVMEVLIATTRDEPPAPRALNPPITPELENLILTCLKKRPEGRYATAREVLRELERLSPPTMTSTPSADHSLAQTLPPEPVRTSSSSGPRVTSSPAGLGIPDKPSIAVLPFQNQSGDPSQDYFADGIVEDVTAALSRLRWLFVIASGSTLAYKGKAIDVKAAARELGVRYVMQGSVRKSGNRVRITGLLVEAESGAQLWADKFDGALDDVFDLQDQITASVVGAIEPSLRQAEVERARRKRPDSLDAWDLVLRALPHVTANSQAEVEIALPLLEQALALDPSYAEAHGYKAWCHEQRFRLTHQPDDATAALHHARLALSHGVQESTPLALGGFVVGYVQGDLPAGLSALEQALAINPNSALALGFASCLSTFAGELEKAREQAERALRLSPLDAFRALPHVAIAIGEFLLGRYATAAAAAVKSAQANPGFGPAHLMLVAARARLGQLDDARAGASRILAAEPKFRVLAFTQNFGRVTQRQDWAEALRSALLEAGLPE